MTDHPAADRPSDHPAVDHPGTDRLAGGPPRTLLVTGAGGAGRTVVAAAAATAAARAGARTLLLSTADRAGLDALLPHGGGTGEGARTSVTGLPLPYPVEGADGLYAARIDTGASFRAGALDVQSRIGTLLAMLGAAPLDPEELTDLPGAATLATLRALREAHALDVAAPATDAGTPEPSASAPEPYAGAPGTDAGAGWDLVVVDLPPVREAVGLLALPEQLRRYLARLLPADRQAARALRPVLAQLAGVPMPAEWAYDAAARADRQLAAVQAVIDDPRTGVAVVAEPGAGAAHTLHTARTGLALYGHRLTAVVANRLLPTGSADPFLQALSGAQQEQLKQLAEECGSGGVPLYELPHLGRAPRTAAELAAPLAGLAAPLAGPGARLTADLGAAAGPGGESAPGGGPRAATRRPDPWTVEDRLAGEGHFVWRLPLPGATRDGLDLVRRGDELVVDAGGFRRIVPLPSALRRCTVAGAALRDGALSVRFTPDPGLWPR